jgi:threonylcarbamoyladenosine tRNA methylthiotransferase MtaB
MTSFRIHTFGCKVNTYDSGLIHQRLQNHTLQNHTLQNHTSQDHTSQNHISQSHTSQDHTVQKEGLFLSERSSEEKALVHIINSCAVTEEATKEAIRFARKIKAHNPLALVVVTGCAAQVDSERLMESSAIDLIVANSHKAQLPSVIEQYFKQGRQVPKLYRSNIFKKEDLEAGGGLEPKHKRAFLKIQDGCNSFCSFCIIPYARGLSRSIPLRDLVTRVKDLWEQDFTEVVLTGVHIGDYQDGQNSLEKLVEALLLKTSISRIRLSSLEPVEVSDGLLDLFSESRLCPHFHMSVQSASDDVLREMKRSYGNKEVRESLDKIVKKVPQVFIGMDVIAGFPTETEAQFLETYQTLQETPWTKLHVFPYSERQGTRAATLAQIPFSERKKRAGLLRQLSLARFEQEALKQRGSKKQVLVVGQPGQLKGLARDYWTIQDTEFLDSHLNQEVEVVITDYVKNQTQNLEGFLKGRVLL